MVGFGQVRSLVTKFLIMNRLLSQRSGLDSNFCIVHHVTVVNLDLSWSMHAQNAALETLDQYTESPSV